MFFALKSWRSWFLALLFLVCGSTVAAAAFPEPVVRLGGGLANHPLDGHFAVLDDLAGGLSLDEIVRADGFRMSGYRGLTTGTRWIRFSVLRGQDVPAEWLLVFGEPDIDDIRVHVSQPGGGFTETQLGRRIPADDLRLAARRHVARLVLPEDQVTTVYVRLSSRHKIRFEEAGLWQPAALVFEEARQSALFGLQFGGLAVVICVYLLFGTWLRDATMLLYAVYVGTTLARGFTHSGTFALVFPGSGGTANYLLSGVGMLGYIAAFILMWDRILDLRTRFPRMHRLYLTAGMAVAAAMLTVMSPAFSMLVRPAQGIMVAAGIGGVVMAAMLLRRDPKDALLKFYLCAFLPIILGWAVEIAAVVSPFFPSGLGRHLDKLATMSHIAILSVALAYRLGRLQRERLQAEVTLAGERLARQRMRTFVDMTSHEFKNPLAVIDSAAQMLDLGEGGARPEIAKRVTIIRSSVQRLTHLIETCLMEERDEEMALRLRRVSPAEIVARAVERNRAPGWPDPVVIATNLPDTCLADPDLLDIALDALIDNARRHGGASQPVEIAVRRMDGHITFTIKDRGPGIPEDSVDRIFEKYYRCPSSGAVPGTGVGLHLVKSIAELHGGEVAYRPRAGGGAIFALSIPATL